LVGVETLTCTTADTAVEVKTGLGVDSTRGVIDAVGDETIGVAVADSRPVTGIPGAEVCVGAATTV
jgi:hypothetical protein